MVANGVIGITAQILESADLGGKEQPTPDMSILQRISMSFSNMRKDWKKMVGSKATGLFYIMLANSKIIQTVIGTTFKLLITLVDILFGFILLPVVKWIIAHLAQFIGLVQNIIATIGTEFAKIFGPIWNWIKEVAISTFPGIASMLGIGETQENVDAMVDKFYTDRVIGTPLTQKEMEAWAEGSEENNPGLITDAPIGGIPESHWDPVDYVPPENLNHSTAQTSTDDISWVYEDGPEQPEGGKLDSTMVEKLVKDGDLKIVDEKYTDEDLEDAEKNWWSWTDDIEQFGWDDVQGWFEDAQTNFTWQNILQELIGTHNKGSEKDTQDAVGGLIDRSIQGEPQSISLTSGGGSPPSGGSAGWFPGSVRGAGGLFYPNPNAPDYWMKPGG